MPAALAARHQRRLELAHDRGLVRVLELRPCADDRDALRGLAGGHELDEIALAHRSRRRVPARLAELQIELQRASGRGTVERDGEVAGGRVLEDVAAEAEQIV